MAFIEIVNCESELNKPSFSQKPGLSMFVDEIASEVSPAFHFCYRHKNLLLFQL
jgi:hypothetical protein